MTKLTAPERIRAWVERQFTYKVDAVFQDLVDVATGNRPGNNFERGALARIFPGWAPPRLYCEFCPGVDGAGCCVCGNDLPSLTPAV